MSGQVPVTVVIAARNEEANLSRCIKALAPASRIVVVDSNSQDGTVAIAADAGAEVVQFHYRGGYPKKRQWALDTLDIATSWVMLVDADEVVPSRLWAEISDVVSSPKATDAYLVTKAFHFLDRQFRFGGFSHSAIVLFRRGAARFEELLSDPPRDQDMEVHERLIVDGSVGKLKTPLIHQDFKGLGAYIDRHNKYSTWEAMVRLQFLETGRWGKESVQPRFLGNTQERRRWLKRLAVRIPFEPQLWFLYHYVLRLGFLEGRPGLIASRMRMNYIADVRAKMYELTQQRRARAQVESPLEDAVVSEPR